MKKSILAGIAVLGGLTAAGCKFRSWKQRTMTDEADIIDSFRKRMPNMSADELEFGIKTALRTPFMFLEENRRELLAEAWKVLDEKKAGNG